MKKTTTPTDVQPLAHTFEPLPGQVACSLSRGLAIRWHTGPPANDATDGAFIETVLQAAMDRLTFHQKGPHACDENHLAWNHLHNAILCLERRSKRLLEEAQGVRDIGSPPSGKAVWKVSPKVGTSFEPILVHAHTAFEAYEVAAVQLDCRPAFSDCVCTRA